MIKERSAGYLRGFLPYALAAFLIGIVGGFTAVLGPAFVKDIGIDYNNTTWTALAMSISSAAFAPLLGRLGDVIGRGRALLAGIFIFALGNVLTAIAPSLGLMILARFVVGIGTAAVAPVVISYIISEFPEDKVSGGFSLYMLISSAAVIFGPTIGAIILEVWNWRIMMWICVFISVTVLLLSFALGANKGAGTAAHIGLDWRGGIFVLFFFGLAISIPSFGQNLGWASPATIGAALAAVLSLILLVIAERRAHSPLLDGRFMMRREFILSVIALFLTQGLMQANMTSIIVFVNYTQPTSTAISGYAISIMYIGMSLGAVLLGPLADKREPRTVLTASFCLTALSAAMMLLFSEKTPFILLASSLGLLGLGLGANATIFMRVALSGIPRGTSGSSTGTYGLFRDLAAPFGVAVLVPLFTNNIAARISGGEGAVSAALGGIKVLALTEIISVALGIIAVLLLPKIHKEIRKNETKG